LRQIIGIVLLACYLLSTAQPYVPHVSYWANKEFIASTLCENKDRPAMKCEGRCHLSKQVKEQQERSNSGELPTKDTFETLAHLPTALLPRLHFNVALDVCFLESNELAERHAFGVFHPPQG